MIIASCLGYTEVSADWTSSTISSILLTFQIVSILLGVPDISVNTRTPEGWTALVAAADKGHHGLVRTLLKHRETDVNIRDNQGNILMVTSLFRNSLSKW